MNDQVTFGTILLFQISKWTKREVVDCLDANAIQGRIRHGFSHFVVVCRGEVDCGSLRGKRLFIAARFDHKTQRAAGQAVSVSSDACTPTPLQELMTESNNVGFDLSNFGVLPSGGSSLGDLYQALRAQPIHSSVDLLKDSECGDLLRDESLDYPVRKAILDVVGLRAAFAVAIVKLHSPPPEDGVPRGVAVEYAITLIATFLSRAMIEKLMILTAMIDPKIDESVLDRARRIKATFLKMAEESEQPLTAEVAGFVESVELLDDNYRTPEVHKKGRLLGLVHEGYYGTALNEILSFQNRAHGLFVDLCQQLRTRLATDTDFVP